ncbi:hypothetical protein RUM44_002690 [Polyplax serrata]|uniref:Uncharacterized protein n=1 Tax=Polyplax serrata TaxID=468196 RepID=A0ABR1AFF7_POLSC
MSSSYYSSDTRRCASPEQHESGSGKNANATNRTTYGSGQAREDGRKYSEVANQPLQLLPANQLPRRHSSATQHSQPLQCLKELYLGQFLSVVVVLYEALINLQLKQEKILNILLFGIEMVVLSSWQAGKDPMANLKNEEVH